MGQQALTSYEQAQVARIARWKGRRLGPAMRLIALLKRPLDALVARMLTADRAEKLLLQLNAAADWNVGLNLIRHEAGLDDLSQLRGGSLERCDELERRVKSAAALVITTESLLAAAGGIATELASLPAELLLVLRTVYRVAGCYGHVLDRERDKLLILAIIGLPTVEAPEDRQRWCDRIRRLEEAASTAEPDDRLERDIQEDIGTELDDDVLANVGTTLLEEKLGESVPLVGEAVGIVLDNDFVLQVEEAARCIFQERWLRESGKLNTILPTESSRDVLHSVAAGVEGSIYTIAYGLGFGLTFPGALISRAGSGALPPAIVHGFEEGARAASRDASRVVSVVKRSSRAKTAPSTGPAGSP